MYVYSLWYNQVYGQITVCQGIAVPTKVHEHSVEVQISLRIRTVWSESSQANLLVAQDQKQIQPDSEDRSACASAQADLSFHWVHKQSCWKCCALAQLLDAMRYHEGSNQPRRKKKGIPYFPPNQSFSAHALSHSEATSSAMAGISTSLIVYVSKQQRFWWKLCECAGSLEPLLLL